MEPTAAWLDIGQTKGKGPGAGKCDFMLRYKAPFGVVAIMAGFHWDTEAQAEAAAAVEAERLHLAIGPEPPPERGPVVSLTDIIEGRA